jgi:CheY-like chemotaxis protein
VERVDGKGSHVLVMDDDQGTLDLYQAVLEDEGYQVTLAVSPELDAAAIAVLAPDLIVLDLRFPRETDGLDVLERLKGDPGTVLIPVLVCSGDTRLLEELHEQLLAWECGVLRKPFDLDAFLAAIQVCPTREPTSAWDDRAGQLVAHGDEG